jgi:hypothetical protein
MSTMKHRVLGAVMIALVGLVAVGSPVAVAAPPGDSVLEPLMDIGRALSLGFGVTPLRPQLTPPVPAPPRDLDLQSTALSLDLKLRWPGSDLLKSFEPYLVVGPALFVVEPDYLSRLLGTRVDPSVRLGAKAGAGVNWHLGRDLTLFGAYEATTDNPSLSGRGPADAGVSGHDFTYGLRLRF